MTLTASKLFTEESPQAVVHLWTLVIPPSLDDSQTEALFSVLGPEEKVRYQKMGSESRRREYLLGHALMRVKLAEFLNCPPQEVPLVFENGEKPTLRQAPSFAAASAGRQGVRDPDMVSSQLDMVSLSNHVSQATSDQRPLFITLSHKANHIAFALAPFPIGVDVETIDGERDILEIANRFFAPEETNELRALSSPDREKRFAEIWSAKEAFRKASGASLAQKMDESWQVHHLQSDENCVLTLVAERDQSAGTMIKQEETTVDWLIEQGRLIQ